ncbi:MAG: thymidine kinase [Bacteroidetes bacterium]|nr:MAG: thymidine kinase [Bacteroidota bacterium]
MFIEVNSANRKAGWIEVVCGSMFSGKTEELIRRLRRAQIANQQVEIFKPALDTRYSQDAIVSHNQNSIRSTPVTSARQILMLASGVEVVGIDEAQFFDEGLVEVARELANRGLRVIIAGLDMDYRGVPFGPMPALLATAEFVTKVHAICQRCGSLANYSYRLAEQDQRILLGEKSDYEPRCRRCYHLEAVEVKQKNEGVEVKQKNE